VRDAVAKAGFATPALDAFLQNPSSLVFVTIGDIVDELDVISG
jgi:hypothetical protein